MDEEAFLHTFVAKDKSMLRITSIIINDMNLIGAKYTCVKNVICPQLF
jgi:hypothetical protein